MKISFLGAARTVTGSCYIVETDHARFAVDCGLHQGNKEIEKRNLSDNEYDPQNLDFILITHAHIDHTGLLPRMVKQGFSGPIYVTDPTNDLLGIMLLDSANIQEMEAEWASKKLLKAGKKPIEPLYTQADAEKAITLFQVHDFNEPFTPVEGIRVNFKDAGHILGSAFIEIWVENEEKKVKAVFSGDLGRPDQFFMRNPSIVESADFLFMESTYGNRDHKDVDKSCDELAEAIQYSYERGEKVIIPAFAVERSQEIIYALYVLKKRGQLPDDMPVFLDSPMAIRATKVFSQHPEYLDKETRELLENGEDPLQLSNLKFTLTAQESMSINTLDSPAIVISASGMCNAGRIKHHLKNNIWKEGSSIVFVGFQAQGTPGRRIVDGAETVRLFGEDFAIKAKIFTIGGFSAHAGQKELLEWLGEFRNPALEVFLVHGEYTGQKELARIIQEKFSYKVHIPDYLDECILKPGEALEQPRREDVQQASIDWDYVTQEMEDKITLFKERVANAQTLSYTDQAELRDRMLDFSRELSSLLTEIPSK